MGVITHSELCGYLLLKKYPDGYTKKGLLSELRNRGWDGGSRGFGWVKSNVQLFCISSRAETRNLFFDKKILDDYLGSSMSLEDFSKSRRSVIESFLIYQTSEEKFSRWQGTINDYLESERKLIESFQRFFPNKKELDMKTLLHFNSLNQGGIYGNVYFNLDGDSKFKFYPGVADNPLSWGSYVNLLNVSMDLSDDELWLASDKSKDLKSRIDVCIDIAKWFSEKFDKDFYFICQEAFPDKPFSDKLKNLTPEFFKDIQVY